jgi:hypothetical protein
LHRSAQHCWAWSRTSCSSSGTSWQVRLHESCCNGVQGNNVVCSWCDTQDAQMPHAATAQQHGLRRHCALVRLRAFWHATAAPHQLPAINAGLLPVSCRCLDAACLHLQSIWIASQSSMQQRLRLS